MLHHIVSLNLKFFSDRSMRSKVRGDQRADTQCAHSQYLSEPDIMPTLKEGEVDAESLPSPGSYLQLLQRNSYAKM